MVYLAVLNSIYFGDCWVDFAEEKDVWIYQYPNVFQPGENWK